MLQADNKHCCTSESHSQYIIIWLLSTVI